MNLATITEQVCDISKETGRFIQSQAGMLRQEDIQTKGVHDFVTYVDKEAEKKIVDRLKKILPEAGFIAEEGTIDEKQAALRWVVDPIDGTTNFIHSIPLYSISIALMDREEVISGVVYEINLDECFYAWKGSEAMLNGEQIRVSSSASLNGSLLATGFPYADYYHLDNYIKLFRHMLRVAHGVRRMGSAAVDLAYVACGRFEGFYEYGLNPWDVAAGSLIVKQAGGKVTDLKGGNGYIFGRELFASNKRIHAEFLDTLHKYF